MMIVMNLLSKSQNTTSVFLPLNKAEVTQHSTSVALQVCAIDKWYFLKHTLGLEQDFVWQSLACSFYKWASECVSDCLTKKKKKITSGISDG